MVIEGLQMNPQYQTSFTVLPFVRTALTSILHEPEQFVKKLLPLWVVVYLVQLKRREMSQKKHELRIKYPKNKATTSVISPFTA